MATPILRYSMIMIGKCNFYVVMELELSITDNQIARIRINENRKINMWNEIFGKIR